MIILDLDDTIFETKSMDPSIFDSAISIIENHYDKKEFDIIIKDIWSIPIDLVFSKYNTNLSVVTEFYKEISEINYKELKIKPFPDYHLVRKLSKQKILVTTGLKELQWAKIRALGIEDDFDKVYIDDPRAIPRNNKIDIFRQILDTSDMSADQIWVIGDNPDSEIIAAKSLRMKSIQRKSESKAYSDLADYRIESFEELASIIDQK